MRFLLGEWEWVKGGSEVWVVWVVQFGSVGFLGWFGSVWFGLVGFGLRQQRQQRCGCRLMEFRSCIKCDTQRSCQSECHPNQPAHLPFHPQFHPIDSDSCR